MTFRSDLAVARVRRGRAVGGTRGAPPGADLPAAAQDLFEALRAWRAEAARAQGLPAYVVFPDSTLRSIAIRRPASVAQLVGISGIGAVKLERYGEAVVGVVASVPEAA